MKAIILAAGAGRRLKPMNWHKPKCLLPVAGTTLIDNVLQALTERDIVDVVLVVGYRRELVEAAVRAHDAVRPRIVFNVDYALTNTVHSLWLARGQLDDDFLYFNADVWFERPILDRLLGAHRSGSSSSASFLAIDTKACGAEDVKVAASEEGAIEAIGKDIPVEGCLGEFIGIGLFDGSVTGPLTSALCHHVEHEGQPGRFFEAAVSDVLTSRRFIASPIAPWRAIEIDTPEDYRRANQLAGLA